jgi:hypothetical protein
MPQRRPPVRAADSAVIVSVEGGMDILGPRSPANAVRYPESPRG